MERIYEFCGRRVADGELEYSNTIPYDRWESGSVCQYTGFWDRHSEKIYERDIVVPINYRGQRLEELKGEVVWECGSWYVRRLNCDFLDRERIGVLNKRYYRLDNYIKGFGVDGIPIDNTLNVEKCIK